jgi:hypothetical protein
MCAATLTETCGVIGPQNVDFSSTPIPCAQFNVAGATLTSITITISGTDTGSITLTNNNTTADTNTSGTISSNYTLAAPLAGFAFASPLFNISIGVGPATIAPNGGVLSNLALTGTGTDGPVTNSNSATFGTYTGTGNFNIPITTLTSFLLGVTPQSNTALTLVSSMNTVRANANVTFNYTPGGGMVPEPSTALFMGAGLVLCLVGARRQRKI